MPKTFGGSDLGTLGDMVNLTRIYTRTGDGGETRLGDMSVTSKNDLRLEAYATVDEANAHLGVALAHGGLGDDVVAVLTTVQNDLFDVGADFCTPIVPDPKYPPLRIEQEYVDRLEALVRLLQRGPARAAVVHPQRRHPRRCPPARRAHRRTPRGAGRLGGVVGAQRDDERPRDHVSQPTV